MLRLNIEFIELPEELVMRQRSSAAFSVLVALVVGALGGCTIGDDTTTVPSPSPTSAPQKKPPQAATPPSPVAPAVRLTQPTNPDQRAANVQRGRTTAFNDPFTIVPITPRMLPPSPSPAGSPNAGANQPSGNQPNGNLPNIGNNPTPTTPIEPELPPLPEPTLAPAIEVSGVVQLGNGDFRIVLKAPQEQSPRYVRIGDRVSNGQVLVKRVESMGDTQVVVLEEVGIEVRRPVGETAANPGEPASASTVSSSTPLSSNKI